MTEVYLLWEGDYEDRTVVVVYDSLEAALATHDGHVPLWRHEDDYWRCEYVDYPVLPDDYVPDFGTPARYCAFEVQRMALSVLDEAVK